MRKDKLAGSGTETVFTVRLSKAIATAPGAGVRLKPVTGVPE
jgi:hypothetical protein